jgi:hypothetical protein
MSSAESNTEDDVCFFNESHDYDYKHAEINIITEVLSKLEGIPSEEQSIDYQHIVHLVQNYLKKNCKHVIVMDLVDIDPDRSQTISYCVKCGISIPDHLTDT